MTDPAAMVRRSPLYRDLAAAGAAFEVIGDAAMATRFSEADSDALKSLALIDLSPLPRTGYKGRDTADWLQKQGVTVTSESNAAALQSDGALAARLAPGEVVILGAGPDDSLCARLDAAWSMDAHAENGMVFPVPRRDTNLWLRVTGEHAPAMFAKICGVDLRPGSFPNHTIAQTSVARLNCIVVRDDMGDIPAWHVLTDSASASYFWMCLTDAMEEFGGRPAGYAALTAATG